MSNGYEVEISAGKLALKVMCANAEDFPFFPEDKKAENINIYFLLGILNSKVIFFWLYHRGKRKGETLELYATPLSQIPVKIPNKKIEKTIIFFALPCSTIWPSTSTLSNAGLPI